MTSSSPFAMLRNSDQLTLLRELARSRTAPLRRVQQAHVALACARSRPKDSQLWRTVPGRDTRAATAPKCIWPSRPR